MMMMRRRRRMMTTATMMNGHGQMLIQILVNTVRFSWKKVANIFAHMHGSKEMFKGFVTAEVPHAIA